MSEDFYIATAPIFATYLGAMSGSEALKYCSLNAAELNEREARRLFMASLTPNPSKYFLEEKSEAARLFGLALAQEEAGVDKYVLVSSFLDSARAIAIAKTEARIKTYESIISSMGALFVLPLFFLFLWAIGILTVDYLWLLAAVLTPVTAIGLYGMWITPWDINPLRAYGRGLLLGLPVAVLFSLISPPLFFLALGGVLYLWLFAKGRLWWFKIREEVPPLLRAAAAMLREGAPPDVLIGQLSAKFKVAGKIAYGYFMPSRYFTLARSMYRAITEAGGATALKAVEYVQTLTDLETQVLKKMSKLAAVYISLFTIAVLVVAYSIATAVEVLHAAEVSGYMPFFTPPPESEVKWVVSTTMALVTGLYISTFMAPLGLHKSLTLGGVVALLVLNFIPPQT